MNTKLLQPVMRPNIGHFAVLAAVALVIVGIEAIATAPTASWVGNVALKQIVFLFAALFVMLLVAVPHHRVIGHLAYPLAIVAVVLLVFILMPGVPSWLVPVKNGARRWINLQMMLFQPSELAKIAFVLALARYLRHRENYRTLRGLAPPFMLTFIPMVLIVREPDLGTSLVFLPVLFAMLLVAGAKLRHLALIVATGAAIVVGVVLVEVVAFPDKPMLLKPHQKSRLVAMAAQLTGDTKHRQGAGFQAYTARTTVGAGQMLGYGKERARTILNFNKLPEAHNDMIFAVICARWGLLGGLAVLGLYGLLIGSALAAAAMNKDPFARLVAVGAATVIFTQVFVNIGMTVGLLPITGMTLPLLSYGGSSLVGNFALVGLIVNAAARRPLIIARPAFEFGLASRSI